MNNSSDEEDEDDDSSQQKNSLKIKMFHSNVDTEKLPKKKKLAKIPENQNENSFLGLPDMSIPNKAESQNPVTNDE